MPLPASIFNQVNQVAASQQAFMDQAILQAYQNYQLNVPNLPAQIPAQSSTEKPSTQQPPNGASALAAVPVPAVQNALNGQMQPMQLPLVAGALNPSQFVLQGPPVIASANMLYALQLQQAQMQAQAQAQAASFTNQALFTVNSNGQFLGYLPQQVALDPSQLQQLQNQLLLQAAAQPAANTQQLLVGYASAPPAENAQAGAASQAAAAPPNHNEEGERMLNVAPINSSTSLPAASAFESASAATLSPSLSAAPAFTYSNPAAAYAGYQQQQQLALAQYQQQLFLQQQQQQQQQLQQQQQQHQLQLHALQMANAAAQATYANDVAFANPPTSGTSTPINPGKRNGIDANGSVAASSSDNSQGQRATPNGTPPVPTIPNGSTLHVQPTIVAANANNGVYAATAPSGVASLMSLATPAAVPSAVAAQSSAQLQYQYLTQLAQQQMAGGAVATQLPAAAPTQLPLSSQLVIGPNGYPMLVQNGAALPPASAVPLAAPPLQQVVDPNTLALMMQQIKLSNAAAFPAVNLSAGAMTPSMVSTFPQAAATLQQPPAGASASNSCSALPALPVQVAPLVNGVAPVFSPPPAVLPAVGGGAYALPQPQAAATAAATLSATVSQPTPIASATPGKFGLVGPLAPHQQPPPVAPQQQQLYYMPQVGGPLVKHS